MRRMAEPLLDRARRAGRRWVGPDVRTHYVICGQDPLAYWVVRALLATEVPAGRLRITLVVPERRRSEGPDGRDIEGVDVIRADRLDEATFRRAGLVGADGLALLHQDDVGNMHAALCAQEVEPRLRLVVRMFTTGLANGVRQIFPDSAVLSDASMAAPAFVAAALGEVAPTHFRHGGRTLYVAERDDVRPEDVVCGVADTRDPQAVRVLPAGDADADVVLAEATGAPPGTELAARRLRRARRRRRPVAMLVRAVRSFATRKIGIAVLVLLAVIAALGGLYAGTAHVSWGQALYLTLVTTLSGQDPDPAKPVPQQVMQVVLNLAGLALIPLITAVVVDGIVNARLALHTGRILPERTGHVVVVGLGNIGMRVMAQLHDFGVEVVAIDKNPNARGVPLARRLGVPVVVGDAALEETLRVASVATCQALVVVSTDDGANLRAALNGRILNDELRVVLRLFDGDFAERVQRAFGIGISRSVSYLAAPSFVAALLDRAVLATIPVGRHALLVTEVPVAAGSALDGRALAVVDRPESVRLLAHARAGQRYDWSPDHRLVVVAGDRLTVVARRAGLNALLREAAPPQPAAPVPPAGAPAPREVED
ncbi:potassium channel protein [Micromonospora endolithica]|uniref:TrkA family potassium uptake protein n=1 Tax=Micromonospora endolithica TaxID=230091 RepID=A0A3A9YSF3_9ACTN|nr:NAD-binding protein [Micromonospora endolithica]RKN38923.1 TrkA family potassium uptake protein [Micromonospora endolithica]TWJ25524.1 Trk K+ transport system NAD-binding subunit [Micromonospora endolithica]